MILYRLSKSPFHQDISGKGAELFGARWNSKGTAMLYTGQSRALAFAELSMHIPVGIVPKDYFLVTLEVSDEAPMLTLEISDLPADWRSYPHPHDTQLLGDTFIRQREHLILRVPPAVVPGDFNFLLNPAHPAMQQVRIIDTEPFEFDSRFAFRGT